MLHGNIDPMSRHWAAGMGMEMEMEMDSISRGRVGLGLGSDGIGDGDGSYSWRELPKLSIKKMHEMENDVDGDCVW